MSTVTEGFAPLSTRDRPFEDGAPTSGTLSKSSIAAVTFGNFLEVYNFTVYVFFSVMIGKAFFPNKEPMLELLAAVATFGVGFLSRPLGAFAFTRYAARVGRTSTLSLTLLMMGLGTLAIVVVPTYGQIGVLAPVILILGRFIQGFAEGGEIGPATTILYDRAALSKKGRMASMQIVTQSAAALAGVVFGVLLTLFLPADEVSRWGWRLPFAAGLLVVPVGLYIRRVLPEDRAVGGVYAESKLDLHRIRDNLGPIALAFGFIAMGTMQAYTNVFQVSYAVSSLKADVTLALITMAIGLAVGLLSAIVAALMIDRLNVKRWTLWTIVLRAVLSLPAFWLIVHYPGPLTMISAFAVLNLIGGFSSCTGFHLMLGNMSVGARNASFGVVYSLAVSIFGALTQPLLTWLLFKTGSPLVPGWVLLITSIVMILVVVKFKDPSVTIGTPPTSQRVAAAT